jgi:6-phosphogluconolactonase (cycloisomerase 2 family)
MKRKQWGQAILATAVSTGLGLGLTSCSVSNTVDYLYMLSSKNNPGVINVYRVDSETGGLKQIPNSPYPAGRNPVGLVIAPNGNILYEINHDDNTVESFGIGTDAKLYPQHTYTTPGSEPVAIAINPAGTLLFVVDYYAPEFTDLNPGYGALVVYNINTDGTLGTTTNGIPGTPVAQTLPSGQSAGYYPLQNTPTAVNVLANGNEVYVTDQLIAAVNNGVAGQAALEAFSVGSGGLVAPSAGSPYPSGLQFSAVTSDATGSFLYVTDGGANLLLSYAINGDGSIAPAGVAHTSTGTTPDALTLDATGKFLYVANRNSGSITSYSVANGVPVATGSYPTGAFPQCVIVDPNLNRFLYTADFQGAGSTGYQIDPGTGNLTGTENSPYGGTGQATCLAATPHNKSAQGKGSA